MKDVTLGEFQLQQALGKGGMAVVWRAVHREQNVPVAIKVLTGKLARKEEFREAFFDEVRSVASLNHPGVVVVLDTGELSPEAAGQLFLPTGCPYLAMELVYPGSLAEHPPNRNWAQVQQLLLQLLDGLAHAHARGIIHRDIKADNVLISGDPAGDDWHAKLSDFGLARALDETREIRQNDESVSGTPRYMAPEQILGEWRNQGPWSDLYSLGCLAWWLVAGHPPFWKGNKLEILRGHVHTPVPELKPRIDVPAHFESWLRRLLAKNPYERYRKAADAALALQSLGPPMRNARPISTPHHSDESIDEFFDEMAGDTAASDVDSTVITGGADGDSTAGGSGFTPTTLLTPEESISAETVVTAGATETDASSSTGETMSDALVVQVPSMPDDWTRPAAPLQPTRLLGAGLGLYGVRTIPLVDREPERSTIWENLRLTRQDDDVRCVIVEGPSGCGKSKIVRWMCERADETGSANVLKAAHSPRGGPRDGLGPMVGRYFRCLGLDADEVAPRIVDVLQGHGASDGAVYYDALTLARLVTSSTELGPEPADAPGIHERHHALKNLLARLAGERPVILWLDDIQWGRDAVAFAEFLLSEASDFPCLLLMTARTEGIVPTTRELLDELESHSTCHRLSVGPLASSDHRELVRQLLGLDDDLVERVAERTDGSPLFAVQLIGDWVQRGVLVVGEEGFELAEDEEAPIPDDAHAVCMERIGWTLQKLDSDERQPALICLELAAALGQNVDRAEWEAVCRRAELSPPTGLISSLATAGIVRQERDGWNFAHGMFPESLGRTSQKMARWEAHHRLCAETLEELYPEHTNGIAARRAAHLVEASDVEEAIDPLLVSASQLSEMGELERAIEQLDYRATLMDDVGIDEGDRRRAEGWRIRGAVAGERRSAAEAEKWAAKMVEAGRREDWPSILGHGLRLEVHSSVNRGKLPEALQFAHDARDAFERAGDEFGTGKAVCDTGYVLRGLARYDEAIEFLDEALALFERLDNVNWTARVHSIKAQCFLLLDDLQDARSALETSRELIKKSGNRQRQAAISLLLGDLERRLGNHRKSKAYYRRSYDLWHSMGNTTYFLPELKIVWTDYARGKYTRRRDSLFRMLDEARDAGRDYLIPYIRTALCVCAAAQQDWEAWDEHFPEVVRLQKQAGEVHRDLASHVGLAGELALEAGEEDRARPALELALEQWTSMEDPAEVEKTRALLERTTTTGATEG